MDDVEAREDQRDAERDQRVDHADRQPDDAQVDGVVDHRAILALRAVTASPIVILALGARMTAEEAGQAPMTGLHSRAAALETSPQRDDRQTWASCSSISD